MTYAAPLETVRHFLDLECRSMAAATWTDGYKRFLTSLKTINWDDYDQITHVYWEAVAKNANTTTAYDLSLYSVTDAAVVSMSTACSVPASTTATTLVRGELTSIPTGTKQYELQVPATGANYDLIINHIQFTIVQGPTATKTVIEVPLGAGQWNDQNELDTTGYRINYVTGNAYAQGATPAKWSRWLYTAANWATISGLTLDAVMASSASYTATVGLLDKDNADAEAATCSTTSTTYTEVLTDFLLSAFTNAHHYELSLKTNNASGTCFVARACLLIKMSSLEKGEVYKRVSKYQTGTAATYEQDRQIYTAANYSNPVVTWEVTGSCADGSGNNILLRAVNGHSGTGSDLSGSALTMPATKEVTRSGAITPTTNYDLYGKSNATTNALTTVNGLLVVSWSGVQVSAYFPAMKMRRIPSLGG
jgi:hypothetical protein